MQLSVQSRVPSMLPLPTSPLLRLCGVSGASSIHEISEVICRKVHRCDGVNGVLGSFLKKVFNHVQPSTSKRMKNKRISKVNVQLLSNSAI